MAEHYQVPSAKRSFPPPPHLLNPSLQLPHLHFQIPHPDPLKFAKCPIVSVDAEFPCFLCPTPRYASEADWGRFGSLLRKVIGTRQSTIT
ncbi:hypothetical protein LINPERHAP1_LOCUS29602 [Linum perenne]